MRLHSSAVIRRTALMVVLVLVAASSVGCANFRESKRVNMAPFAENTVGLIADIRQGMDAQTAVYLRDYIDGSPVGQYGEHWRAYRPMLRGIAAYSIAIVTISKLRLNDTERSQKLAEVLDEFLRPRVPKMQELGILSEAELDEMLANIRVQTKYLDALNAAQPLVDAIERFTNDYLDFMDDHLASTRAWLDRQVRDDHATSQDFYETLIESQNFAFEDLVLLRNYRQGIDPDALDKLLARDPQLKVLMPEDRQPTLEDTQVIEDRLVHRLKLIREMTAQVRPDLDLFRNKMLELDQLSTGASNMLVKTRVTVILWSRAHRGLARGITDPAKWDAMGMAKQALKMALPI